MARALSGLERHAEARAGTVRVNKQVSTADVAVDTQNLDEEQRVEEIARMLSGKASEQSLQHARELLAGGTA